VITSPEVLTAIGAYNGEGISVTNANEFAEAAGSVLEDPASAARVGIRGRQLVQSRFTWETGITALFSAYEVAVSA
jgi:glycosyltransferase involved in cell wall biosynthesis